MKMNKKISKNKNTKDDSLLAPLESKLRATAGRLEATDAETLTHACSTDLILPDKDVAVQILRDLRKLIFPGYFGSELPRLATSNGRIVGRLRKIAKRLLVQVQIAYAFEHCRKGGDTVERCPDGFRSEALATVEQFLDFIPLLREKIMKDIEATYQGDPAANSREEIIFSYPGVFAIFVYRVANRLFELGVPFLPRMMSEYANSRTGIEISPGASIGEYLMIDHGTGVVIGQTTTIGDRCKIYQGVTLGALTTRDGQALSGVKRHPTVGNDVTIYANATILGGDTTIGDGAVIGGNAFITKSVPPGAKISGFVG